MSDNTYNGWTNHDTWNVNLWLNNNEVTYKECRRICKLHALDRAEWLLKGIARQIIPKDEGIDYSLVSWEEIYNGFNEE